MDFDVFDRSLGQASLEAVLKFRQALESSKPNAEEIVALSAGIKPYRHTTTLEHDFRVGAVDGSGIYPLLQQDDVYVHFATAAGVMYDTQSKRQHKLAAVGGLGPLFKDFVVLRDDQRALQAAYQYFVETASGVDLQELVVNSDYCEVFSRFGKSIHPSQLGWAALSFSHASQIASHTYILRTVAELAIAIQQLEHNPKYLLLDTSLVYFLLGDAVFLPELLKRYLITQANAKGIAVVAVCKTHGIPNGDFIARTARDDHGLKSHWYLRLPSAELGDAPLSFLRDSELPPKLSVSYLFKFESSAFPMRIDVDADWWKTHITDSEKESRFFEELDFTCHEIRSYGYPYPMYAAHRRASLTKQEQKAIRAILHRYAQEEGIGRNAFTDTPEQLHMSAT